jgi:hypothetical protein
VLEAVPTVALRSTPLSRTGFYDRMQRVHDGAIVGRFITPEELEQRRPTLVSQVLQGLPSVRVQRAPDGRAVVLGRGGCPMTVLLDGQRRNGLLQDNSRFRTTSINPQGQYGNGDLSLDEATNATEVMAIEVYNSTANAPSELIPTTGGGSCRLIAIWTGARRERGTAPVLPLLHRHSTHHLRIVRTAPSTSARSKHDHLRSRIAAERITHEHRFTANRRAWMRAGFIAPGRAARCT